MTVTVYERPEAVAIETQLVQLAPRFAAVLGRIMQPERLIRTIMISLDRTPKLYECDRQSIFNAALSAACLGLEVDGVTGQAYLLPFKGRAQLVVGYRGFATLAARSGYAVRGAVIRQGDDFESDKAEGLIRHRAKLGNDGRIIGAWARAVSNTLPAHCEVMSIEELMAIKAKSPGASKSDSPWNDPKVGFPAMCEKTPKRRLARSMPLNVMQLAAAMDEAVEERNRYAWITPDRGVQIEGGEVIAPTITGTPALDLNASEFAALPADLARKAASFRDFLNSAGSTVQLNNRWARAESAALRDQIGMADSESMNMLKDVFDKRHVTLTELEESTRSVE